MSMRISYDLKSLLPRLSINDIQDDCKAALSEALRPLVSQYATNISIFTGKKGFKPSQRKTKSGKIRIPLKQGPASKVYVWRDGSGCTGIVGIRTKESLFHAHLVDKGTGPRRTKDGKSRGVMPAFYCLQQAVQTALPQCAEIYVQRFKARIDARL